MAVNVGYLATWLLLMAGVGMMVAACTMSEWTTHQLLSLGLWKACARLTATAEFECAAIPHQGAHSGFLVTAQVAAVWGTAVMFFSCSLNLLVLSVHRHRALIDVVIAGCNAASVVLLGIAWGCWLGVHRPHGRMLGAELGTSWIVVVIAWTLMLAATATSLWGWKATVPAPKKMVRTVPGLSEEGLPGCLDLKADEHPQSFSLHFLPPTPNNEFVWTVNYPEPFQP
eukprot:EG_transcript_15885